MGQKCDTDESKIVLDHIKLLMTLDQISSERFEHLVRD